MARITAPTSGRITMHGRVGTLLEVGTGFHPDLTGRENVFLNGSILGMSRRDIARRFDEIVDYAGVERFIDTPVKRYSSGMYVRLAFAVAAHLEPDILLVDEVLAVGDEKFQKKCLGTMREVALQGRTVVFVSHGMDSVRKLCSRAYLIRDGGIEMQGKSIDVIRHYLEEYEPPLKRGEVEIPKNEPRVGNGRAIVQRAALLDADGRPAPEVPLGAPMTLSATIEVFEPITDAVVEFGFTTTDGMRVASLHNTDEGHSPLDLEPGVHQVQAAIDLTLLPAEYGVDVALHHAKTGLTIDMVERVLRVVALSCSADGADRYPANVTRGFVRPASAWRLISHDETPTSALGS
jgi:homopolymeric O-antigen transport system ATP-binding protein